MTELEKRALLGDKQAQQECTEKGVALPCPFCEAELIPSDEEGWLKHPRSDCPLEGLSINIQKRLKAWNTRPVPPIGRCVECKHSPLLSSRTKGMRWCRKFRSEVNLNDFCSDFKPKESEEK